ncbi:MAG: DUF1150 family protein [Silicimonas sp.]|nr:DUF1150 family protein [Silicimonas sp.]NNF90411.1 DUF1150 family protein [Boseongicola sp.]RZW05229.1 MAG: DUF1150 family protein [Paracoccaceae bacterium]NND21081.1 DUF1150 family protein [Silicimonas sp.]NND40812.1 DUF1150 family protein [Silicimonas sp.]
MNTKFDFKNIDQRQLAYIRPVEIAELPEEVRAQAEGRDHVYAVHNAEGDRLALVADRNMAFLLARENDLAPVNVH